MPRTTDVSFFQGVTPQVRRQLAMAKRLEELGKPKDNEVVSGIVVEKSPVEGFANALSTALGGYMEGKAYDEMQKGEDNTRKITAQALETYKDATTGGYDPKSGITWNKQDPRTAAGTYANLLMQDPNAAEAGVGVMNTIMSGDIEMQNAKQKSAMDLSNSIELAREKAKIDAQYGTGNQGPAPVQILNEVERRMKAGDKDGANMLLQIAKVYDKGINPFGGDTGGLGLSPVAAPGYGQAVGSIAQQTKGMERTGQLQADLTYAPLIKEGEAAAKERGTRLGEAEGSLKFLESNMPKLESMAQKLSDLGKVATYTLPGRGADFVNTQLMGRDPSVGAVARSGYTSMVDNEILPLLRDTFGAAFTAREGDSLRATLGDPNKSPQEKDIVLKSFIDQKRAQVESLKRQVSPDGSIPAGVRIIQNPATGEQMIDRGNGWEPLK